MASKVMKTVDKVLTFQNVLSVRNYESSFCEFYELSSLYMFALEEFNYTGGHINISLLAPNYFTKEEVDLSSTPYSADRALHQHNFFEIMYVLKGCSIQKIESQEYLYHAGQCCLLNHNVRHVEQPTEDTELFFLILSDEFLNTLIHNDLLFDHNGYAKKNPNPLYQLFFDNHKQTETREKQYWDFYPLMPSNIIVPQLEELFARLILENKKMEAGSYLMIQAIISKIFSLMLNPSIYSIRKTRPDGNKNEYLFTQIHRILEEQNGRIHRTELAEMLNYSDHYLNRIVKSSTGMSLHEYGKIFTLKETARLLVQTNLSISAIMNRLGLTNRTAFYQSFKKQYNVTPNEYRNNAKTFFDTPL